MASLAPHPNNPSPASNDPRRPRLPLPLPAPTQHQRPGETRGGTRHCSPVDNLSLVRFRALIPSFPPLGATRLPLPPPSVARSAVASPQRVLTSLCGIGPRAIGPRDNSGDFNANAKIARCLHLGYGIPPTESHWRCLRLQWGIYGLLWQPSDPHQRCPPPYPRSSFINSCHHGRALL